MSRFRLRFRALGGLAVLGLAVAAQASPIPAGTAFVASTYDVNGLGDGTSHPEIHYLDNNLVDLGHFTAAQPQANDLVAVHNTFIYSVYPNDSSNGPGQVVRYNLDGSNPVTFANDNFNFATAVTIVPGGTNGRLAVSDGSNINFFNIDAAGNVSTAISSSIAVGGSTRSGSSTDAIAYGDGFLFEIVTDSQQGGNPQILRVDLSSNTTLATLSDPLPTADFGGTGLAFVDPHTLVVAGNNGDWQKFSDGLGPSDTGSGNNALPMYGLSSVPEPTSCTLAGAGAVMLLLQRRRRTPA